MVLLLARPAANDHCEAMVPKKFPSRADITHSGYAERPQSVSAAVGGASPSTYVKVFRPISRSSIVSTRTR